MLLGGSGEGIEVDRVVCLPLLDGPDTSGLPLDKDGFAPVDVEARVPNVPDVYAAGDATTSRIKQGGLACQRLVAAERLPTFPNVGVRSCPAWTCRPYLTPRLRSRRDRDCSHCLGS